MSHYLFRIPAGKELILASASPRRRELLSAMGLSFTVCPADADETVPPTVHPRDAVVLLAERKALSVAQDHTGAIILASDTLVELDGRPLGKPQDAEDAITMLLSLAGREHRVHTGVAVWYRGRLFSAVESTRVLMRPFDREEACTYVASGEPMDKAGAYGIQGLGGRLVAQIVGEFDNVVGLPTVLSDRLLCRAVEEMG